MNVPDPAEPTGLGLHRAHQSLTDRRSGLLLCVMGALAVHGLALGLLVPAHKPAQPGLRTKALNSPVPVMTARQLELPAPLAAPTPTTPAAQALDRSAPAQNRQQAPAKASAGAVQRPHQDPAGRMPAVAVPSVASEQPAKALAPDIAPKSDLSAGPAEPLQPLDDASSPPPTYATQAAPATTLQYDMTGALRTGQATLQWNPNSAGDGRYQLSLQIHDGDQAGPGWTSSGLFDAAGLAPVRYTAQRRQRVVQATNFQRDAGLVSYSAQTEHHVLMPGVQDRGSWLLQLGAILQANPDLAQPGAVVTLAVAGTRGAPEHWQFRVADRAPLMLSNGASAAVQAVHLVREPLRPYGLRVLVWLDPAQHHLPLKWQLEVQGSDRRQSFERRSTPVP